MNIDTIGGVFTAPTTNRVRPGTRRMLISQHSSHKTGPILPSTSPSLLITRQFPQTTCPHSSPATSTTATGCCYQALVSHEEDASPDNDAPQTATPAPAPASPATTAREATVLPWAHLPLPSVPNVSSYIGSTPSRRRRAGRATDRAHLVS